MNVTSSFENMREKPLESAADNDRLWNLRTRCWVQRGRLQYALTALIASYGIILTQAASLEVGGYDQPSNLRETFGVYGDVDANFVSDQGRTDGFAYKLILTNKGHKWGSCAIGISRDIHAYRCLSFWIRSPQGASAMIGLTDSLHEPKPIFAKPLSVYLRGGTGNDWRQVVIPLADFTGADFSNIVSLVIEIGSKTARNAYGNEVFIDDIRLLESDSDAPENPKKKEEAQATKGRLGARSVEANLSWLKESIHPRTGLIQASVIGRESWTFVCATALRVVLAQHDVRTAAKIGEALLSRQNDDGSWPGGWDYANGAVIAPNEKVGEVAWACMALLELHSKTRETKYLEAVRKAIQWANQFQILDASSGMLGAYRGGRDREQKEKNTDFRWISAEHQADMLCVLYHTGKATGKIEYFARAKVVADWIADRAWDKDAKRFKIGYEMDRRDQWIDSTFDEPTDVQAWLPMALAATCQGAAVHTHNHMEFAGGIHWLLLFEKTVSWKGQRIRGFSTKPLSTTNSVNADHMLYVILGAKILRKDEIAQKYTAELDKLRNPDGLLGVWMIGPKGAGWPMDFRWPHATAICFDTFDRNPFELTMQGTLPNPRAVLEAVERLTKTAR